MLGQHLQNSLFPEVVLFPDGFEILQFRGGMADRFIDGAFSRFVQADFGRRRSRIDNQNLLLNHSPLFSGIEMFSH
jgi:hypothetical protein